jgi:HAD superfamily hydrolase (TIGR01509 family)
MALSALLFDVDGTLADTEEVHRQAFNGAFSRHGYTWYWSPQEYADLLRVTGGKERISAFIRSLNLGSQREDECLAQVMEIHRIKTELFIHTIEAGGISLRPGIERLLGDARGAGLRLAVVTTTTAANVESLLGATLGETSLDWFDVVIAGDRVPAKKPAPDAYHAALDALALPPEACVAFEDSRNGLLAAQAAGVRTVVTPCQWTRGQDFSEAWLVLPELGEPTQPLPAAAAARLRQRWLTLDDLGAEHGRNA